MIGSASTDYTVTNTGAVTVAFNYDPSANPTGSFSGNGTEILFRRGTSFLTPNSGDTAFNQQLTMIDGNIGIGTTSPETFSLSGRHFEVDGRTGDYSFIHNRTTNVRSFYAINDVADLAALFTYTNHPFTFGTNNTERARITAAGELLLGDTSQFNSGKQCIAFSGTAYYGISLKDTVDQTNARFIGFINSAGTVIGSIDRVTTTHAVTYLTSSDYRLKTVIGAVANAGQRIDALQPVEYTWNDNGERARGFLAHQFQEVYASSVSGTKDAVDAEGKPVYQSMQASTSEVIADLVAELQSVRARLAALESK